jgi:ADP-ribose pyrophosphatase YjhB (NUDIX family)
MNKQTSCKIAVQISLIADELRSLSDNGQHWTDDPYQIERFTRLRALAAELQSLVDTRPLDEIQTLFSADLDVKTPLAVVDTAVLDPLGQLLLIQRADDTLWALPGGACDVGESPATAAAREVREETGYEVEITHLLGVFDSRYSGTVSSRHLYHLLFAGVPVHGDASTSLETLDVRWFDFSDIPWTTLSPGHHFRIQQVLAWWLNPSTKPYFDRDERGSS